MGVVQRNLRIKAGAFAGLAGQPPRRSPETHTNSSCARRYLAVPGDLRDRMQAAKDPVAEGAANAREMVALARERFAGVCIMPPFDHYEVMFDILT